MNEDSATRVRELVDDVYRSESRQVLATLIRLLGDFDAAEEAMHDAFAVAVEQWARDGVPSNPRAWLVSTGRFKAIDGMRRRARFDASLTEFAKQLESTTDHVEKVDEDSVEDDRLRLVFTCCHPALSPDAQVAMTLREVCGLTTDEIARAFLTKPPTIAQRIVRAKAKIRDARIPYEVPAEKELPDRLDAVLRVVYLVFNEGYSASSGGSLIRHDLSGEAIRLGRSIAARAGSAGSAGADAAPRLAARVPHFIDRRFDTLGRPRSCPVESRSNPGGNITRGTGLHVPPDRSLYDSSGDRRGTCRGTESSRDGLGSDRRVV